MLNNLLFLFTPKNFARNPKIMFKTYDTKEVAPEMELFLENHKQYKTYFVITLIYIVHAYLVVHFAILQKNVS